jgi:chromosome segregation ATPase
VLANNLKVA